LKNKKGNLVLDLGIFLFAIVGFVMISVVINNLVSEQNTEIQSDPEMSPEAKSVMSSTNSYMPKLLDGGFLFLLFGVWIWLIVSSLFIDSHPAFFIIGIIAMILVCILGMELANIYDEFITQDPDLATTSAQYTITNFVINHFLATIIVIITSVVIVLFAKNKLE